MSKLTLAERVGIYDALDDKLSSMILLIEYSTKKEHYSTASSLLRTQRKLEKSFINFYLSECEERTIPLIDSIYKDILRYPDGEARPYYKQQSI